MLSEVESLRITSWNVAGLAPHLGPQSTRAPLNELLPLLQKPDLLCLQEVRLRLRDTESFEHARTALLGWSLSYSLADDPKNARFRGGRTYGVATYARSELESVSVPSRDWDREGRLAITLLPAMKLAVLNVYAVNGTDKPYWDHDRCAVFGDRHEWKRRFHDRVVTVARTIASQGLDLLLIGDWNISQARIDTTPRLRTEEPHATSRAHFQKNLVEALDVVDVFRALYPEAKAYSWFNLRARHLDAARVDFALLSRSRMADVIDATIDESALASLGSDQAPIHVVLRTTQYPVRPSRRRSRR